MFKKFLKFGIIFLFTLIFIFSNFMSAILNSISRERFADNLKINRAQAAPGLVYVGGTTGSGTAATYNVALNSLTGGSGSSAQAGDLVIVVTGWASTVNGDPGVTTAGYTEVYDLYGNDTRDANVSVNWKIMGGTPDISVTVTGFNNAANGGATVVQVWRGADKITPMDVTPPIGATSNNSSQPDSPSITPITTGAYVLSVGLGTGDTTPLAKTSPVGYGNAISVAGVGSTMSAIANIASKSWSGSGAEDPAAWTGGETSNSDSRGAGTLAIRPVNDPPLIIVTQPDGVGDVVNIGDPYNITYDLTDADSVATVDFYYDSNGSGLDGTAIIGCQNQPEGLGAICLWDTTGMSPGDYYIYGIASDGINPTVSDYSPGVITINALTITLTVGSTAGDKIAYLDSGSVSQYVNDASCLNPATCAAFTLSISSGSETITSIKVTEIGTIDATNNLSNITLFYDTDGNYSNGVVGQFGATAANIAAEAATVFGSLAISAGNTYYFYVRFDLVKSGTYPTGGQTINFQIAQNSDIGTSGVLTKTGTPATLAGVTIVRPDVSIVTYPITSPLNGARIGQSVIIDGYGFGTICDGTNSKIQIGLAIVSCAGTTFSNTSISVANLQYLSGDSYGGAGNSGILVTSGGTPDNIGKDFYIYPNITDTTNPVTPYTNAAREYDSGDADGVITLNGNHFGSAQGGGSATVLGQSATINSWTDTAVQIQIPAAIPDNSYTGNIVIFQGIGGNSSASDTFGGGTYRILPRITGFVPSIGSIGESVSVDGNHFCQGGSCPIAFDVNNKVVFNPGVDAINFSSWTDTNIATVIPSGAITGNATTTSNGYNSNGKSFTLTSPTPADPTLLDQFKDVGLSQQIIVGGAVSSTQVYLKQIMEVSGISGGILYPQFEYKLDGVPFTCGAGVCGGAVEGVGVSGPGPATGSKLIILTDGPYHWQARTRHNKSGVDYYSNWTLFNSGNVAFVVDAAGPAISAVATSNVQSNSANINWTTNELSSTRVQYNKTGVFGDCVNDCTILKDMPPSGQITHSQNLSNLDSGTTYYYRVRSIDSAGNESVSSNYNFATTNITQPAKTIQFYASSATGIISGAASSTFSISIPEDNGIPTTKSSFMEITGISSGGGINNLQLRVNSQTSKTYAINASTVTYFKIIHDAGTNINLDGSLNTLYMNPSLGTYIISAKVIATYSYAP